METIVITASAGSFSGLAEALREMPARLIQRPLVRFGPPADWNGLDRALIRRARYGSLALTSPRAAAAVSLRIQQCGITWGDAPSPVVWAVGPATADALAGSAGAVRCPPSGLPGEDGGEKLARAMLEAQASGPVLFPCGDRRRAELPDVLSGAGIEVDEVVCYRSLLADPPEARAAVAGATMVVAASPSVVRLLLESCPATGRPALVAIGPTTAAAAREGGWEPAAIPSAPLTDALAATITGLLTRRT